MIIQKKPEKITIFIICLLSVIVVATAIKVLRNEEWFLYKTNATMNMVEAEKVLILEAKRIKTSEPEEEVLAGGEEGSLYEKAARVLMHTKASIIDTTHGSFSAKKAAIDPNFAAVIVEFFKEAGVRRGDTIAVGFTSSLPGANLAVLSAAKAMELKLVIITSVGGSRGGGTDPEFTWLDMQTFLYRDGIFPYRSAAASLGGLNDIQEDKTEEVVETLKAIIKRNDVPLIYNQNLEKSLKKRMAIYKKYAGDNAIKAYVNVGGGVVSLGEYKYRKDFPTGVFFSLPFDKFPKEGVITSMARNNVPVINIRNIIWYVGKFGLRSKEGKTYVPGEADVFKEKDFSVVVSMVSLLAIGLIFVGGVVFDEYLLPKIKFLNKE